MTITLHEATVPVFKRMLTGLSRNIGKAVAHAEAHKFDPAVLVSARLYPDMLPFWRQVTIATDHAKGAVARLSGQDVPVFQDNEASMDDLQARIERTLSFVSGVSPEAFEGSDTRQVTLTIAGNEMSFAGKDYLLFFALPNFYFHVTTAYDILRHNGVPLGKRDFMGAGRG